MSRGSCQELGTRTGVSFGSDRLNGGFEYHASEPNYERNLSESNRGRQAPGREAALLRESAERHRARVTAWRPSLLRSASVRLVRQWTRLGFHGPDRCMDRIAKGIQTREIPDEICNLLRLPIPSPLPAGTAASLTYRVITAALRMKTFAPKRWICLNGVCDSSGFMGTGK